MKKILIGGIDYYLKNMITFQVQWLNQAKNNNKKLLTLSLLPLHENKVKDYHIPRVKKTAAGILSKVQIQIKFEFGGKKFL